jgi:hypothetical protein
MFGRLVMLKKHLASAVASDEISESETERVQEMK